MQTYKISAHNEVTDERMELFTWSRSPDSGIARAKQDAKNFGMDNILSDYKATEVNELYAEIADRTEDAYSCDRYGNEWANCAKTLLVRGYTEAETEWVLRSKWMRWAADQSMDPDAPKATDLASLLDRNGFNRLAVQREMNR